MDRARSGNDEGSDVTSDYDMFSRPPGSTDIGAFMYGKGDSNKRGKTQVKRNNLKPVNESRFRVAEGKGNTKDSRKALRDKFKRKLESKKKQNNAARQKNARKQSAKSPRGRNAATPKSPRKTAKQRAAAERPRQRSKFVKPPANVRQKSMKDNARKSKNITQAQGRGGPIKAMRHESMDDSALTLPKDTWLRLLRKWKLMSRNCPMKAQFEKRGLTNPLDWPKITVDELHEMGIKSMYQSIFDRELRRWIRNLDPNIVNYHNEKKSRKELAEEEAARENKKKQRRDSIKSAKEDKHIRTEMYRVRRDSLVGGLRLSQIGSGRRLIDTSDAVYDDSDSDGDMPWIDRTNSYDQKPSKPKADHGLWPQRNPPPALEPPAAARPSSHRKNLSMTVDVFDNSMNDPMMGGIPDEFPDAGLPDDLPSTNVNDGISLAVQKALGNLPTAKDDESEPASDVEDNWMDTGPTGGVPDLMPAQPLRPAQMVGQWVDFEMDGDKLHAQVKAYSLDSQKYILSYDNAEDEDEEVKLDLPNMKLMDDWEHCLDFTISPTDLAPGANCEHFYDAKWWPAKFTAVGSQDLTLEITGRANCRVNKGCPSLRPKMP